MRKCVSTVEMYFLHTICEFDHNAVTGLIRGASYSDIGTYSVSSWTFLTAVQRWAQTMHAIDQPVATMQC